MINMKIVERFLTQQINLEENSIINYRIDIEKFLKHCSQILNIPIEKENKLLDNILLSLDIPMIYNRHFLEHQNNNLPVVVL